MGRDGKRPIPAFCRALFKDTLSSPLPLPPETFPQLLEPGEQLGISSRPGSLTLSQPLSALAAPPHRNPGSVWDSHHPPPAEASGRKRPSSASEGEWTQAWSLWFPNLSKASYFCFSHFPFMITKTFPPL